MTIATTKRRRLNLTKMCGGVAAEVNHEAEADLGAGQEAEVGTGDLEMRKIDELGMRYVDNIFNI